ncbi:hypothetical protein [Bacillus cereus]|uniref:Uncharacterized protein n=1 Tax=Bacillus cereus TaxID=1396 RepID=A0A2C1DU19_BACCE|nr:hypothetical protein [Bacillus cereus]PGT03943.1 hypothetical protein COD09_08685 [Bacillus cereus]
MGYYDNSSKGNYKYCKSKKDEKFDCCCCDTDSLRDLLLFFRRNNTPIFILSETFPFIENPTPTPVFINSIVGNLVYISRGSNSGQVIALIPLYKIDYVLVSSTSPIPGLVNLINEIIAEPTLEKDDCCYIKGVGDTINSVSNISSLFPLTNAILSESFPFVLFILLIILLADNATAVANDDLYILYSETQNSSLYLITPVCNIDSLIAVENLGDANGTATSSTTLNSFLSYLNKDMKEKFKNIDTNKLFKEISEIPFTEALKKLNSALS